MPRPSIPWDRLKALYVERNLERGQGTYSLRQLTKDEGQTYLVVQRRAKREGWREAMEEATADLEQRVTEEVAERVRIDQVQIRTELLELKERLLPLAHRMIKQFEELWDDEHDTSGWDPSVRELVTLVKAIKELSEVGGGLPREHKVTADDQQDEVQINRERQRWLAEKVTELAEWKKDRDISERHDFSLVGRHTQDPGGVSSS